MIRYVSSQMAYQMEENSLRGCVPEISAILCTLFLQRYTVGLRQIRPFGQLRFNSFIRNGLLYRELMIVIGLVWKPINDV